MSAAEAVATTTSAAAKKPIEEMRTHGNPLAKPYAGMRPPAQSTSRWLNSHNSHESRVQRQAVWMGKYGTEHLPSRSTTDRTGGPASQ